MISRETQTKSCQLLRSLPSALNRKTGIFRKTETSSKVLLKQNWKDRKTPFRGFPGFRFQLEYKLGYL